MMSVKFNNLADGNMTLFVSEATDLCLLLYLLLFIAFIYLNIFRTANVLRRLISTFACKTRTTPIPTWIPDNRIVIIPNARRFIFEYFLGNGCIYNTVLCRYLFNYQVFVFGRWLFTWLRHLHVQLWFQLKIGLLLFGFDQCLLLFVIVVHVHNWILERSMFLF